MLASGPIMVTADIVVTYLDCEAIIIRTDIIVVVNHVSGCFDFFEFVRSIPISSTDGGCLKLISIPVSVSDVTSHEV